MKKIILILIFLLIFIRSLVFIEGFTIENCIENIYVQIGIYEPYLEEGNKLHFYKKSNYQINSLDGFIREGDFLFIETLQVDVIDCKSESEDIYIKTKSPSQDWFVHHMGGHLMINKKTNFTYTITHKNPKEGPRAGYIDSFGNTLNGFTGFQELDEKGVWEIGVFDSSSDISNISDSYFVNSGYYFDKKINVLDRLSVTELETLRQTQRDSNNLFWISTLIIILVGAIPVVFHIYLDNRKDKQKQVSLLESLHSELSAIGDDRHKFKLIKEHETIGNLLWFKDILKKKTNTVPGHGVWYLSNDLYIGELSNKINDVETKELKKMIIFINQKISLINEYVVLIRKNEMPNYEGVRKGIIKIIDETIGYVKETKDFIEKKFNII